ncbi:hypothetical protein GXW82_16910 [Streptacidiphilus sp. 4-A2]|nr:hypothetical protein [Streptacidiphilus sp. 4-A2]
MTAEATHSEELGDRCRGSGTTALLDDGTRWRVGSVNHASVGGPAADSALSGLLRAVAGRVGPAPSAGWLATATLRADAPQPELDRLARLAERAGLRGTLVVSRDIVPLLLAPPLGGRGVAVVCGTGSGFLAGDGARPPTSIGGCEYLGSDEGSAFALGLEGLRAAVRGADGRGRPTALGRALAGHAGAPVRELARRLAAEPFPRPRWPPWRPWSAAAGWRRTRWPPRWWPPRWGSWSGEWPRAGTPPG